MSPGGSGEHATTYLSRVTRLSTLPQENQRPLIHSQGMFRVKQVNGLNGSTVPTTSLLPLSNYDLSVVSFSSRFTGRHVKDLEAHP